MAMDLMHATSASNSAFRVVCGELKIDDNYRTHKEAVFGLLRKGTATVEHGDTKTPLKSDDIFFVAPSVKHRVTDSNNAVIDVVTLNLDNHAAVTQDYLPQSIVRAMINGNCTEFAKITSGDSGYQNMLSCLQVVNKAENDKSSYFQLQVYAKMYELFYELFSNKHVKIVDVENKSKKYRALMRVTRYIDDHYSEGVSLEEVAEATGISRYYVSHLFKELMSTTFVGYVNELRLNRAAMLLLTTDRPIIEIASMSGFNNLSNFNRAFKMHFDKTPSVYRKS